MLKGKILKNLLFNFFYEKTFGLLNKYLLLFFICYIMPEIVFCQPYDNINVTVSGWVHNVEGVPDTQMYRAPLLDGITLIIKLEYEYYSVEQNNVVSDYESQTVISGYGSLSKGQFIASFDITKPFIFINQVVIELQDNSNWFLKSAPVILRLSDTYFEGYVNIVPLVDLDKNGINDPFEFELAKKFAPQLKINISAKPMLPEPVQIMGTFYSDLNSELYITITTDKDKKSGPWRLDLVDIYNFESNEWDILMPEYQKKVGEKFNYSKFFQYNPVLYPKIKIQVWNAHGPDRGDHIVQTFYMNTSISARLWYHFDFPGNDENSWPIEYNLKGNKYKNTIYAVIWNDNVINKPVIQYWFFYPYDDWINDHEGDWEHINVIIDNQNPDKASIVYVDYYFHEEWYPVEKEKIIFADPLTKTHPMVFIGGYGLLEVRGQKYSGFQTIKFENRRGYNSNGSYPWPGGSYSNITSRWNQVDYIWGMEEKAEIASFEEFMLDNDPYNGKGIELLKEPSYFESIHFYDSHPEYSWFNTDIRFGEPKSELIVASFYSADIDSKHGPSRKAAWKIVGPSSEFKAWKEHL